MPYSPVEVRHVKIGRGLFGYKREEADSVLEEIANSFESVWRDRGELTDKVEELERRLEEFKQREQLLSATLVAAERSAAEAKEAARREADLILAEAHNEARSVTRGAQGERDRLVAEARRVQTLLRSALDMVEESLQGKADADPPPDEPPSESWPARHDTRELPAVSAPEPEVAEDPDAVKLPPLTAEDDDSSEGPFAGRDFAWG